MLFVDISRLALALRRASSPHRVRETTFWDERDIYMYARDVLRENRFGQCVSFVPRCRCGDTAKRAGSIAQENRSQSPLADGQKVLACRE
jgi:hypothetical protein